MSDWGPEPTDTEKSMGVGIALHITDYCSLIAVGLWEMKTACVWPYGDGRDTRLDQSETAFKLLSECISDAARAAFDQLRIAHPETFYYFALITSGEAFAPWPSAWSEEALEQACRADPEPDEARHLLRWSYADSPYCGFGEECFTKVNELFERRFSLDDLSEQAADVEYQFRLDAMEDAMVRLDNECFFGKGEVREKCMIHVEVMPPDQTNAERAIRMNSGVALTHWLRDNT